MIPLASLAPRWSEISALLDRALALRADEREAWLHSLTEKGAELRDVVRELLAAHAHAETADFLATAPRLPGSRQSDAASTDTSDPATGDTIGPYRLISLLGRGGMGLVWLAEHADGQLKRRVALKLPRLAWGAAVGERLARERDILATLAHPNIARLYDAGVDRLGRPYLAMEYVEGRAIDVYCRDRALPVPERLGLLLQVAAAVAHAHARLVVHRDLKPANILVTADGQVRLLDFGIAKLMEGDRTEETALTRLAGRALTLDYASPEQIRGEPLGTASDVYSLAVVAYELLSGTRPYRLKRASAAELEEAIASIDPPPASAVADDPALKKRLRGDLDAILQQALRKDPAQRYPGVDAFAADIERHLNGQPVRARPDSLRYRAWKFVRRNRLAVGAAAAVILTIGAGTGVALWQAVVARTQAQLAQQALGRQEAVRQLYVETLSVVSSWDAQAFARPGSVMQLLQDKLQELEPEYRDRPQELLAVMNAVSVQLSYAGDFAGALNLGRKYLALLKTTQADTRRIVFAHMTVGRALEHLGRSDESESVLREAVSWALSDGDLPAQQARAAAATDLGRLLMRNGKRPEAAQVLLAAEAVARRAFPADRDRFAIQHMLGRLNLGFDDATALQFARQAHAGNVAAGTAESGVLAESLGNLGTALLANGQAAEAEVALRESHRRCHELYGSADRDTVTHLGRLASALALQGKHAAARALLVEPAAALAQATTADARAARLMVYGRRLDNEMLYGDLQAASALFASDGADTATLDQPALRDADVIVVQQARLLAWTGRADEAVRRTKDALAALKPGARSGPAGHRLGVALAEARLAQADADGAWSAASDVVNQMRTAGATRTWTYRAAMELKALAAGRSGRTDEALRALPESGAAAVDPLTAPSALERAESLLRRAQIHQAAGRTADAVAAAKTALVDLAGQHPHSPRLAEARRLAGIAPN